MSVRSKAMQLLEPLILSTLYELQNPNKPSQSYVHVYLLQANKEVTHLFLFLNYPLRKHSKI